MGNDGGSIPKRRELVKSAARAATVSELKATALESLSYAWTYDPVSSEPLDTENVVSDWRGRLYNYETILQGLLPRGEEEDAQLVAVNGNGKAEEEVSFVSTGIKSLRDVVRLQFKRTETGNRGNKTTTVSCPISLKELGPATKSVYLVPCGHVFAEIAIKEIAEQACPVCSDKFQPRDVVPVLPTDRTDLERLAQRIDDLKAEGLTHSLKKEKGGKKKDKKRKAGEEEEKKLPENGDALAKHASRRRDEPARAPREVDSRLSGINNAFAASLTAKVLADQDERNKRRKVAAAR